MVTKKISQFLSCHFLKTMEEKNGYEKNQKIFRQPFLKTMEEKNG
jgi:hypothetical protein